MAIMLFVGLLFSQCLSANVCKDEDGKPHRQGKQFLDKTTGLRYVVTTEEATEFFVAKASRGDVTCPSGDVVVPATYTGSDNCKDIPVTYIPDTLTGSYEGSAFYECKSVTSLVLPDSVVKIGSYAFWELNGMKSITISDKITTIEPYTFYGCKSLTAIKLPSALTTIKEQAFRSCIVMTQVILPPSVVSIENRAFYGMWALEYMGYCGTNVIKAGGAEIFGGVTRLEPVHVVKGWDEKNLFLDLRPVNYTWGESSSEEYCKVFTEQPAVYPVAPTSAGGDDKEETTSGVSTGMLAGIIAAGVAVVGAIAAVVIFAVVRSRRASRFPNGYVGPASMESEYASVQE